MPTSSPPPPDAPPAPDQSDIVGVVLAGGASRRMGTDKAQLRTPVGDTLLDLAVRHLRHAGATHVVIASGPAARYDTPIAQVPDPPGHVGDGPLAGLAAAFAHLSLPSENRHRTTALVLAVDLPDADPALLHRLADLVATAPAAAAIPLDPTGRPQPLHAAYDVDRALPAITAALERGERRLLPVVLDDLRAATVQGPTGDWHRNLNTLDDLWRTPPPVG